MHWAATYLIKCAAGKPGQPLKGSVPARPAPKVPTPKPSGPSPEVLRAMQANQQQFARVRGKAPVVPAKAVGVMEAAPATKPGFASKTLLYAKENPGKTTIAAILAALAGASAYSALKQPTAPATTTPPPPEDGADISKGMSAHGARGTGGI